MYLATTVVRLINQERSAIRAYLPALVSAHNHHTTMTVVPLTGETFARRAPRGRRWARVDGTSHG